MLEKKLLSSHNLKTFLLAKRFLPKTEVTVHRKGPIAAQQNFAVPIVQFDDFSVFFVFLKTRLIVFSKTRLRFRNI